MNKHSGFDQVSWLAFQEAALGKYDFSTCQRADGSYYGTGGTCRKGTPATKPEGDQKGKAAGGGSSSSGGGGGGGGAASEANLSKQVDKGDVDGMLVKGSPGQNPKTVMKNVGKQLEKEYGVKMDANEANGERMGKGYVDGFVSTKGGKSFSVSMEHTGESWSVESIMEL